MDYKKYFSKKGWITLGAYYATHPDQLQTALDKAKKYLSMKGLAEVKEDLSLICHYVRDVVTGEYKEYSFGNLVCIVGALVYVITPIDMLPDFMVAGLVDDVGVLMWATKEFGEELNKYKQTLSGDLSDD